MCLTETIQETKELVAEYKNLQLQQKAIQERIDKIKADIIHNISFQGTKKTNATTALNCNEFEAEKIVKEKITIKPEAVNFFKSKNLPEYITTRTETTTEVTIKDLENALKAGKITEAEFNLLREIRYSQPELKIRPIKKESEK